MPNARRKFTANSTVLITSRIKSGLPFACNRLIGLIIYSILARAQCFYPVKLSHFIFMGNHFHMILYVQSASDVVNFIGYLKKQLTEYINKLTGKKGSRWQIGFDAPVVLDPEKVLTEILYLYNNPVKANLVESIKEYPGVSSFEALGSSEDVFVQEFPKIKLRDLPCLKNNKLSEFEINKLIAKLSNPQVLRLKLKTYPYIWAKSYQETKHLSNLEIQELILQKLEEKETQLSKLRIAKKQDVLGVVKLRSQSMFKKHRPKTFGRRMLCLSSSSELRKKYIRNFRVFCRKAYQAYLRLKSGQFADFPYGSFRPSAPPLSSSLSLL